MITKFNSFVAGIPCIIQVDDYEPTIPGHRRGHPDNWEDDIVGYFDYTICDRTGRPAPWLDKKETEADQAQILEDFLEALKNDQ